MAGSSQKLLILNLGFSQEILAKRLILHIKLSTLTTNPSSQTRTMTRQYRKQHVTSKLSTAFNTLNTVQWIYCTSELGTHGILWWLSCEGDEGTDMIRYVSKHVVRMLKVADASSLYNTENAVNVKDNWFLNMGHLMVSKTLISYKEQEEIMWREFPKVDWV